MTKINQENIAYAASTLPIAILNKMAKEWGVRTILVASKALAKSYGHLNIENNDIRIIVIPQNPLSQVAYLTYYLCTTKLLGRHIYFFNECCCLYFDIIIGFIKPNGSYFPQVSLNSFVKINLFEAGSGKHMLLLKLLRLHNSFTPYLMDNDDNKGTSVVLARSAYPKSIKIFTIEDSYLLKSEGDQFEAVGRSNNILFLLGSDVISNDTLRCLYLDLINRLSGLNYILYGKDHPNPKVRLNIIDKRLINIDPHIPVELLKENFDFVIGAASTGLFLFKDKAISVMRLFENTGVNERRILHFAGMQSGSLVNFPSTMNQLIGIIENKAIPRKSGLI